MSADAALDVLVDPDNLVQTTVTVPEGLRVEEVVERLAKGTDIRWPPSRGAGPTRRRSGCPATPRATPRATSSRRPTPFRPNADAVDMLATMVDRWQQAAEEADLEARAEELGYTPGELMIVASLVESEANRDQDRGKVARVIYNRLETDATNGLLQIDATVNYALGRDLGLALTTEDLQVDSPYNTRRYPGLPPGADRVARRRGDRGGGEPDRGDWVYYVTVNLDTGETKFTDDYDEFLRYKRELRRGARAPTAADGVPGECGTTLRGAGQPDRALAVAGAAPGGVRRAGAATGPTTRRGRRGRAGGVRRRARRLVARAVADDAAEAGRAAAARRGRRGARPGPARPTPS